jgi:hypothetical protein
VVAAIPTVVALKDAGQLVFDDGLDNPSQLVFKPSWDS